MSRLTHRPRLVGLDQAGASIIEYVLLVALIALVAFVAVQLLGTSVDTGLSRSGSMFNDSMPSLLH